MNRCLCRVGWVGLMTLACLAWPGSARADETPGQPVELRLWQGDAPGAQGKEPNDVPTLTLFRAPTDKANGAAVIVCPGGGYGGLAFGYEGLDVAKWFNTQGVTAAVLKYRLGPKYHHPVEMHDVQRAIRMFRANSADWKIDPKKIGVLGFSAGGHLASTAATHFDNGDADAADPIDKQGCRPDFAILIYPVITMEGQYAHGGSRENLLGKNPPQELVDQLSSEKQVTDQTPPTFIVYAIDDPVHYENGLLFLEACRKHHVPVELHILEHGGHGFGLGHDPDTAWPLVCERWMTSRGLLPAEKK